MDPNNDDALVERVMQRVLSRLREDTEPRGLRAYYSFEQAAELLCISHRTLRNKHFQKKGPKPTYVGRLVRFHHADLAEWLAKYRARKKKARA